MNEKDRLNSENPQATSALIGDLNASESEWLDTDRLGATYDSGCMAPDAAVLTAIRNMRYSDLTRTRYPTKRVVTRAVQHDTNRLLNRIMVTKEIGKHQVARVAVYKHSFFKARPDHLMVAADLPVDTAGAAGKRVEIWQPYEFTKWSNRDSETKKDEQAAHEAYRTMLQSISNTEADDILWVQKGDRGHSRWLWWDEMGCLEGVLDSTKPQ